MKAIRFIKWGVYLAFLVLFVLLAAPSAVRNGQWADNITRMTRWQKLRLSVRALRFIWGPSQELTP